MLGWELGGVPPIEPLTAAQEAIRVNHRAAFHSLADELVGQRNLGALAFGYPYTGPYPPAVEEYIEAQGLDNVLEVVCGNSTVKPNVARVRNTARILGITAAALTRFIGRQYPDFPTEALISFVPNIPDSFERPRPVNSVESL